MSRTTQSIKMLGYLQAHKHEYKSLLEISEFLEEKTTRNVRNYKNEIHDAGYSILSKKNTGGGYKLESDCTLYQPNLTKDEKLALYDLHKIVNLDKANVGSKDTFSALTKIIASFDKEELESNLDVIQTHSEMKSSVELNDFYTKLRLAVVYGYKIEAKYRSIKNNHLKDDELSKKMINPYDLVRVDGNWYCVTFSNKLHMTIAYKLNRFVEIEVTNETFWRDPKYNLSSVIDELGLIDDKQMQARVKLELKNEAIQGITENPVGIVHRMEPMGDRLIYEADIRGDYKIQELCLKYGPDCTVLGPKKVKDRMDHLIKEMYKKISTD
ncbi:WYL domain-containing protein [Acidaminobacter sp. JC074]|uniref:helix-turn-helix transcriptional regulator n=1 Tax=Acidaminobacter sp. JC074 TaxID=2530199 RepID=UPI001F0ECE12|nr:WYL domain-containing protein [Acidaminobacter sp. JC074]MCH4887867.1 WYL domain-containing protein [Acidaminobacter sp. JC074]